MISSNAEAVRHGLGSPSGSRVIGILCVALSLAAASTSVAQAQPNCAALRDIQVAGATVTDATEWAAGRVEIEGARPFNVAAPFCRVQLLAKPAPGSQIRIEVWLPQPARWNGRLAGIGNPGLGGSVPHRSLGSRIEAGYAAVGTDSGHQGRSDDASWALGQPDKITDYGHRAVIVAARYAKSVASAYFARAPDRSYFIGFSNGGREALMLAQRDPTAYDGIVAGAPAIEPSRTYVMWAQLLQRLRREPQTRLSPRQSSVLSDAVLAACDDIDGRRDGVLMEPLRCRFDPAALQCPQSPAPPGPDCLSPSQVRLVRDLHEGMPSQPGERPFGPLARGSEPMWRSLFWDDEQAPQVRSATESVFRHMVVDDKAWDIASFSTEREGYQALKRLAPVLDAKDPDLTAYFKRGGRLILWHGWNDAVLSPMETIAYYEAVVRAVGPDLAARSVRLFLAPGVEHGASGPGAGRFGQVAAGEGDPLRSLGAALRRWVESGVAPEQVIAVRHQMPNDPSTPVTRSVPLCAWPAVASYRGSGSADDADNFVCRPTTGGQQDKPGR